MSRFVPVVVIVVDRSVTNVPEVVVVSAVNREWSKRQLADGPRLSDLRGSGALDHHADTVVFPWRMDRESGSSEAEWVVEKNRGAQIGRVPCWWNAPLMRFEDLGAQGREVGPR